MTKLVPRTCTEVTGDGQLPQPRGLAEYRATPAYVLLGDSGAGKTSSFAAEAWETAGCFISARDFQTFDVRPEWRNRTLFIDGLDETRAAGSDGRVPLDQIRRKLDQLGHPWFRLSCREADWLGDNDRVNLQAVAPGGEIVTLRLDPLTGPQVREILDGRGDVPDAQAFLDASRAHGLDDLLANPQTLDLLVKATRGGQWPDSKKEVFELACRESMSETNSDHRAARRGAEFASQTLLDAAGHLCSVLLLSGEPSIALTPAQGGDLSVEDFQDPAAARAALATRLFIGQGGTERFAPVHRTIAEYLAGRHLARLIEDGLPVGRVLALMTGADGVVVSGLRGLHAWLAVHCPAQRSRLIASDPLGVVLYGDVGGFPFADKTTVLQELAKLARDDPGFRRSSWIARPFGALCTPDMEEVFRDLLTSPSREPADQALTDCVVDALHYGPPLPALHDVLLSVVRQDDRWPAVRYGALQTCLRHLPPAGPELDRLLDDLGAGRVADDSDELLGMCLEVLYPGHLTVHRLLDFLHTPKQSNLIGSYLFFWTDQIAKTVPADDIPVLLDELATRGLPDSPNHEPLFQDMTGALLVRGLEEWGDRIEAARLYAWLGVGLDQYGHPRLDRDDQQRVQDWLSARPGRYKDVTACAIDALWNPERPALFSYGFQARLHGATVPNDFGYWLLSRAETCPDHEKAEELFEEAVRCFYRKIGHEGLLFDFLEAWVEARPQFRQCWQRMLYCEVPESHWERASLGRQRAREKAERRTARARFFREHLAELSRGTGHPQIFHEVANAYKGRYYNVRGDTPVERLEELVDHDSQLVLAALSGLKQAPFRPDLPDVEEIVSLDLNGEHHYIRLPCLVAAQEHFAENPDAFLASSDAVLKRLVAFRLTDGTGATPEWVNALAGARPDLYADVLTMYATQLFASADKFVHGLYALCYDESYAGVARRAVPRLLELFPTVASEVRLGNLEDLLKAGLKHLEADEMVTLVAARLARQDSDDAQRTYVLATATVLDPATYQAGLREFVGLDPDRARHLLGFLQERIGRRGGGIELPASVVRILIELLGPVFPSVPRRSEVSWVSPEMEASEFVETLIHRLGADPTESATQQIAGLLNTPRLEAWWPALRTSQQAQRVVHREAAYRHPSPAQVQQTLAQGEPASVADLAALTGETLRDLAHEIRDGNTDGYKQFWNLDQHARPTAARVEDACRDTLLDRLRERLRVLNIDAQPEGHYADDRRADIRVSFGGSDGFNVPIEIKRDCHADLWHAMHEQLIPQYSRDPGAAGYGIYLAFWFGGDGIPANPAGTARPRTAGELENQLRALLRGAEQPLIQVCVMDVARPTRPVMAR